MKNKISIIIPTFNRLDKLKFCLESIFFQDYKNYEIIVIDNYSNDGTEKYINHLKKNIKINYLKIYNGGNIAKSRNKGILNSTGEYLAFIDSDDQWTLDKLSKSIKFIEENNLELFYHNMFVNKPGIIIKESVGFFRNLKTKDILNDLLFNGPAFPTSSVIVKKSVFAKINYFNEDTDLITWEDFDAWIRFSKISNKFGCLNENLGILHVGRDNTLTKENQIKNILSFKKKYLNLKKEFPNWCLYSLISSSFKLRKYKDVIFYLKSVKFEQYFLNQKIKLIFFYLVSRLLIFLIINTNLR